MNRRTRADVPNAHSPNIGVTARSWWRTRPVRRLAAAVLVVMLLVGVLLG